MKSSKVINDLLGYKNFKIVQNPDWFSFSLDSVLLPNFVSIPQNTRTILDLGTGNAPIPMILTTKTSAKIIGIELQSDVYEMAVESLKLNNLNNKVSLINDNMKNIGKYFEKNSLDIIVTNPPYFKITENSKLNDTVQKKIARHEIEIKLEEIINIAKQYLDNNGIFAMVHRTDRLIEIIDLLTKNNIEPKKIQFIHPRLNEEANMLLIEGRKNGNPGMKILPPLFVHNIDGSYTDEVKQFFEDEV